MRFLFVLLWLLAHCAYAQPSHQATGPHIEVALLSEQTALVPGERQWLGVYFQPEQQWHTYWRNPGDSGEAPSVSWAEHPALTFGDIHWPAPVAIPVAHLVNYGYAADNLLLIPVDVAADAPPGESITLTADLSWLVCKEDCIPGWATLALTLPVASSASNTEHAALFAQTKQQLPAPSMLTGQFEIQDKHIVVAFTAPNSASPDDWRLWPWRSDLTVHSAPQQVIKDDDTLHIVLERSPYFSGVADTLSFLLTHNNQAYQLIAEPSSTTAQQPSNQQSSIWLFVLMAFAGGVILNLMPCVLPILSIKALALQQQPPSLRHKLAYLFGVLACFNLFALVILALKASGQEVGWGFHMQQPAMVIALAFLFLVIALSLLDVMQLGGRLSSVGERWVGGHNASSHFATGVLAVVVASPCTAPFMAASLGVAMVSNSAVTLLLFNALALGFSLPVTLLFFWRGAQRLLPKPGAWMVTFKKLLAFPMLATVAWLCWVYTGQAGSVAQFVLLLALLSFAFGAFLLAQPSRVSKAIAYVVLVASLAIPFIQPVNPTTGASTASQAMAFDPERLDQLRNNGELVLLNLTADWCITCKVNEQVALSTDTVQAAFKDLDVHYMVGDWTNKNDTILNYLRRYERAGVPLYVVYAGNKYEAVLPQLLTPAIVIQALQQAAKENHHAR